jgi:hypothetical protein
VIRDLRRHPATELATALAAEQARAPEQLAMPWAPAPVVEAQPAPDHVEELAAMLVELVADFEHIGHPVRTCRSRTPGACEHWNCQVVWSYRVAFRALAARGRAVLGGRR